MDEAGTVELGDDRLTATCLIVAYNQEKTMRAAIQSALDQTVPFNQIVVVDDGSTDTTLSIAGSFGERFGVQVLESPRLGPQGALNLGIEAVSSDVVFLLGGDDLCLPRRVERQTETLCLTGADAVFCLPILIDEHDRRLRDAVRPGMFQLPTEESLLLQLLVRGNFLCAPTAAVRMSALPPAPVFRPNLTFAQDYDLWLRMLLAGSSLCVDEDRVVAYRVHHSSLSGDPALRKEGAREAYRVRLSALAAALTLASSAAESVAADDIVAIEEFLSRLLP